MATAFSVKENSTAKYTATLEDENGDVVSAANLTTFTLTLYNLADESIINSRNSQNVLNNNNVTVSSSGAITWTMQPADNPIVNTTTQPEFETHVALWQWTWDGGNKSSRHETEVVVQNFTLVT